ncbi:MAG: energy transducer TonB [Candidatus Aminicenantales bacterium]
MKVKKGLIGLIVFVLFSFLSLWASDRIDLKLRVYEGARQGTLDPPKFVTSSYIQPTITANMQTGFELEKEKRQIQRVFNLQEVALLTEADLVIGEERAGLPSNAVRHFFRLNGNAFAVYVSLLEWKNQGRFLVLFNEMDGDKPKNVLTTEMLLLGGHSAIFGFEDKNGKPYFCSFYITGPPDKILAPPPPPPPAPPAPPELKKQREEFEEGAVKARNVINPPRLLNKVNPVYPEEAIKTKLNGFVTLNVRTDKEGNVKTVIVLKSSNEIFNKPAIDAVKQWKYEPYFKDGEPKEVVFTVWIRFKLQ